MNSNWEKKKIQTDRLPSNKTQKQLQRDFEVSSFCQLVWSRDLTLKLKLLANMDEKSMRSEKKAIHILIFLTSDITDRNVDLSLGPELYVNIAATVDRVFFRKKRNTTTLYIS